MPKRRRSSAKKAKTAAKPSAAPEKAGQLSVAAENTKYRAVYATQARKLAQLGATDREAADFFEVSVRTYHRWKLEYPAFAKALALGKEVADRRVERTLYQSALGYEYQAEKPFVDKDGGEHVVEYREFVKPDTTAGIFWMKNRDPDNWRDRREMDASPGLQRIMETWNATVNQINFLSPDAASTPQALLPRP